MPNRTEKNLYDLSQAGLAQRIAAKVAIIVDGEMLILHPSEFDDNRRWQLPGGLRDDLSEPIAATGTRELKEEIGLVIDPEELKVFRVGEWTAIDNGNTIAILAVFFFLKLDSKPEIMISEEHDDYTWISRDNHNNFDANREVHEIVLELL